MVSLLELMLKSGGWTDSAYVSFDWDVSPEKYSEEDLSGPEGRQIAGRWYCRPPALSGHIARTQSGLFVVHWYSENPASQWFPNTHYTIGGYSYNKVSKTNRAFVIDEPPTPMDWSKSKGLAVVVNANYPTLRGKNDAVTWVRLRP